MIVSSSKCKSTVVYTLYRFCPQKSVSFLHDLQGSRDDVYCVRQCGIQLCSKQLWTDTWNCSLSYNFDITVL